MTPYGRFETKEIGSENPITGDRQYIKKGNVKKWDFFDCVFPVPGHK